MSSGSPQRPRLPSLLIARVSELWRYPVKSMGGEKASSLSLELAGFAGDRRYAFRSEDAPVGRPLLRSGQRASLIPLHAQLLNESEAPYVRLPSNEALGVKDPRLLIELAKHLGEFASLHLQHSPGKPLTDVRPVSLLSLETVHGLSCETGHSVDPRRFRSNIHLEMRSGEPFSEDALAGKTLRIGNTATLHLRERIPRCRIAALDPDTAEFDRGLLRHLDRHHQGRAGIYASPTIAGTIRVGDEVTLIDE